MARPIIAVNAVDISPANGSAGTVAKIVRCRERPDQLSPVRGCGLLRTQVSKAVR